MSVPSTWAEPATKGRITKGIRLFYGDVGADNAEPSTWTEVVNVQAIPDMGGTAETIEVTTFQDHAHTFINGLLSYGDSIEFTLLHDATQFAALAGIAGAKYWKVNLPDGATGAGQTTYADYSTKVSFIAESSIKINGVGTNEALTDTLALTPQSTIEFGTEAGA